MRWKPFAYLFAGVLLVAGPLADLAESGGRGARGGGGFSRGGGGFARGGMGGMGGNYGSIRNSAHRSSWDSHRPSTGDLSRPSAGAGARPSYGQLPSQRPRQQPIDGRDRIEPVPRPGQLPSDARGDRPGQLPSSGSAARPEQRPAGQRGDLQERMQNLTPEQKDALRERYENSGLEPSQLPSSERDRDEIREDWQDWRDENREDWQDWYEDQYEDYWDDYWYPSWWYGYPVSMVSFSFYIDDTPPCDQVVVINQATGTTTYYYCNSIWYQPALAGGDPMYVVTSPPAGAELAAISEPTLVTVDGRNYFLSNHVFYTQIVRDGQILYVTVDAPVGARVPTIPQYAVEIQHEGQSYYRFDRIFYQQHGDAFVVVANPGV